MTYREGRFWQPDVTVAPVVERDGRLLLVEVMASGRQVLTPPAGQLKLFERLVPALRTIDVFTRRLFGLSLIVVGRVPL